MEIRITVAVVSGETELSHTQRVIVTRDTRYAEFAALVWQGFHALANDSALVTLEMKELSLPPMALLNKPADELDLSIRSANILQNAGIRYIGELIQRTEADMLKTKNCGRKSLKEIREALGEMHLQLGTKLVGWAAPTT